MNEPVCLTPRGRRRVRAALANACRRKEIERAAALRRLLAKATGRASAPR